MTSYSTRMSRSGGFLMSGAPTCLPLIREKNRVAAQPERTRPREDGRWAGATLSFRRQDIVD